MELLFLLKIGVVLSQTFQSQLITEPDHLCVPHIPFLEVFDLNWVGSREEKDLVTPLHDLNDLFNYLLELIRQ